MGGENTEKYMEVYMYIMHMNNIRSKFDKSSVFMPNLSISKLYLKIAQELHKKYFLSIIIGTFFSISCDISVWGTMSFERSNSL